jgi:hypothetical protein
MYNDDEVYLTELQHGSGFQDLPAYGLAKTTELQNEIKPHAVCIYAYIYYMNQGTRKSHIYFKNFIIVFIKSCIFMKINISYIRIIYIG